MSRGFIKEHKFAKVEVQDLNMEGLQRSIQWSGNLRLHQLNEDSESLLAETRWPNKTGPMYYACASTGLLFDKQSGRCLQSSNVTLRLDTIKPLADGVMFKKWHAARIEANFFGIPKMGYNNKKNRRFRDEPEDGDAEID